MKIGISKVLSMLFLSAFSLAVNADTQINVVGLFSGSAVLMINGSGPQTLRAGQTVNGVKLVSADSTSATLLVEGKRKVLGMGQAASIGGAPSAENNAPVKLFADSRGHFFGNMSVNGVSLKYLVDTGASAVSMNSADAKFAKIDYLKGQKEQSSTANGLTDVYVIKLNTLKLGAITLNNVECVVHEGGFPTEVLLGMSALNRLDMTRDSSVMTLKKKF